MQSRYIIDHQRIEIHIPAPSVIPRSLPSWLSLWLPLLKTEPQKENEEWGQDPIKLQV